MSMYIGALGNWWVYFQVHWLLIVRLSLLFAIFRSLSHALLTVCVGCGLICDSNSIAIVAEDSWLNTCIWLVGCHEIMSLVVAFNAPSRLCRGRLYCFISVTIVPLQDKILPLRHRWVEYFRQFHWLSIHYRWFLDLLELAERVVSEELGSTAVEAVVEKLRLNTARVVAGFKGLLFFYDEVLIDDFKSSLR